MTDNFTAALEAFKAVPGEDGQIQTAQFVHAARSLSLLYDALFAGVVAKQLKNDIMNSAHSVDQAFLANPELDCIEKLVPFEIALLTLPKVRKNKKTGTIGALWAKRAIEFITVYLHHLVEEPDASSGACASKTYGLVLKRYHGWMISGIVGTALGMAPKREKIYKEFGLTPEDASERLREMVVALRLVVDAVQQILVSHGCDFPDKA